MEGDEGDAEQLGLQGLDDAVVGEEDDEKGQEQEQHHHHSFGQEQTHVGHNLGAKMPD